MDNNTPEIRAMNMTPEQEELLNRAKGNIEEADRKAKQIELDKQIRIERSKAIAGKCLAAEQDVRKAHENVKMDLAVQLEDDVLALNKITAKVDKALLSVAKIMQGEFIEAAERVQDGAHKLMQRGVNVNPRVVGLYPELEDWNNYLQLSNGGYFNVVELAAYPQKEADINEQLNRKINKAIEQVKSEAEAEDKLTREQHMVINSALGEERVAIAEKEAERAEIKSKSEADKAARQKQLEERQAAEKARIKEIDALRTNSAKFKPFR